MARPRNPFPVPTLRKRGESWQIRWRDGEKRYAATIGAVSDRAAKALRTLAAAALTGQGEWPPELQANLEVRRYIREKENIAHPDDLSTSALIDRYVRSLRNTSNSNTAVTVDWGSHVSSFLTRWLEFVGDLDGATPSRTLAWFESLTVLSSLKGAKRGTKADSGRKVSLATRNRARAAISGFVKWLQAHRIVPKQFNPLEGTKAVKESRTPDQITVWDNEQVPGLLLAADKLRDGIAVWIAVLAGLRRSEIAHLEWPHIGEAYISIFKSKTLERQVPLSSALAKRLEREPRISSRVVGAWPEAYNGWDAAADDIIYRYLPREFPPPAGVKYPPRQYAWNTFRHTFASRHVQAGIALDLVAAWIGDTHCCPNV